MGTHNGHNVPFLESASLKKRKRKALKRIKQIYKIPKKGKKKKKKKMPSEVPKVAIDLLFEGSWKYRRRERVPKAGSRRETITEPIDSGIGVPHNFPISLYHLFV